jgi:hypothetical protein
MSKCFDVFKAFTLKGLSKNLNTISCRAIFGTTRFLYCQKIHDNLIIVRVFRETLKEYLLSFLTIILTPGIAFSKFRMISKYPSITPPPPTQLTAANTSNSLLIPL